MREELQRMQRSIKGGVRFAPSPTGTFHLGNLRTAWISHEWARALNKPWVLRFEDIDRARVLAGSQQSQLRDIASLGLVPDEVMVQSDFSTFHQRLFYQAVQENRVYACFCSRKDVATHLQTIASAPHEKIPVYDGHCRHSQHSNTEKNEVGWRYRDPHDPSGRSDFLIGRSRWVNEIDIAQPENLERLGFQSAYHWACGIDDYVGDFDLLVRAWDLEEATVVQRQIALLVADLLREKLRPLPAVFHCSLLTDNSGRRLEKRTQGVTLGEITAQNSPKMSTAELIKIFKDSFQGALQNEFSASRIWGEAKKQLTLRELGFKHIDP